MTTDLVEAAKRNAMTRRAMLERLRPTATAARQEVKALSAAREGAAGYTRNLAAVRELGPIPGFFPTPQPILARLMALLGDVRGCLCLEPSAGKGNIADALRSAGGIVHVCEINPALRRILEGKGYTDIAPDFLELPVSPAFDAICANPPFENGADRSHVRRMFDHLAPGGRLVSVMGEGVFFRSHSADVDFRAWLEHVDAHIEKNPDGSFAVSERSTNVATRIVAITKPKG